MAKILVIDHKVARPDRDSGSLRMAHFLRVLDRGGHGVVYLPQTLGDRRERHRYLELSKRLPFHPTSETSIRRHLRRYRASYDLALLCRPEPAKRYLPVLRRLCPGTRLVFDTVDLHFLRELRQSEIEGSRRRRAAALRVRATELEIVRNADATLVVSTVEKRILERQVPGSLVHVLSNIHRVRAAVAPVTDRRGALFVAGYEHAPNVDAAVWLVGEIMPQVWKQLPELELTLVGSHPPPAVTKLAGPRVTVTGSVPEVEPFLGDARLALAPIRFGAGVKGKITQSLAAGLPVIATPVAVEGMPITPDQDILVADRPETLATLVTRLARDDDLWRRLSENGRRVAERHFSFAAAGEAFEQLLARLQETAASAPRGSRKGGKSDP